jgi:ABC-type multidrug transport system permease subunit
MSFTVLLIKILEYMFVAGWIGSAIVLVLTGVEDVGTLLDKEDEASR